MAISWGPYRDWSSTGNTYRVGLESSVYRDTVSLNAYIQFGGGTVGNVTVYMDLSGSVTRSRTYSGIPVGNTSQQYLGMIWSGRVGYGSSPSFTLTGYGNNTTGTRSSVSASVSVPTTTPAAPSSGSMSAITSTTATATWNRSNDTGGESIIRDELQVGLNGSFTGSNIIIDESNAVSPFAITGLQPGTSYRVRVRSVNSNGAGSWRTLPTFTTLPLPPDAPTDLSVVRVNDNQHTLNWTNAATYTAVDIWRRDNVAGTWAQIGSVGGSAVTYSDTTTVANREYTYEVRARNSAGTTPSNQVTVRTTPGAPTNASVSRGVSGLEITWQRGSTYPVQHEVWNADNGTWDPAPLDTVAPGVLRYVHNQPSPLATHQYRVRAVNNGLFSTYALTPVIEIAGPPLAPTLRGPGGAQDASEPITLLWQHNPVDYSDQTRYQVRWRYLGDSVWNTLAATNSDQQSATMPANTWVNGTAVEWQVRTRGAYPQDSPWSPTGTFSTSARPTGILDSPAQGGVNVGPLVTAEWSYTDPEGSAQSGWELTLLDSDGQTVEQRSGSGATSTYQMSTVMPADSSWTLRLRVRDGAGVWSLPNEVSFTVEYLAPVPPVLGLTWQPDSGTIEVDIQNLPWSQSDREALETAILAWRPDATIVWSETPPADTEAVWANPLTGAVRVFNEEYCSIDVEP